MLTAEEDEEWYGKAGGGWCVLEEDTRGFQGAGYFGVSEFKILP